MYDYVGFIIALLAVGVVIAFLSKFAFGGSRNKVNKTTAAGNEQLKHRLDAEIEFAENLCKFYPAQAEQWQKLIEQAKKIVAESNQADKNYYTNVIQGAERILAPVGVAAKTYTIYCIGHAHIDMNWMWSWPETVAVTNDTFITVLKLMDEFDDFHFSQSQASVYAIIKEHNPELFERIKQRVAQGRWEVTAAQWVEGDKNIASGESIARHLLYTRPFMKDNFNLKPEDITLCWEPDTFGHAYTIPTILSRGGIKRYYLCRGGFGTENEDRDKLPRIFWWEGPDGSRLLVNYGFDWYNGHIDTGNTKALLKFCEKTGLKDWLHLYGVGDHGGGPTRRDIMRCIDMNSWPIYPNFKMTAVNKYFETIEKYGDKFPVIKGELNFEFTGCYTSQSQIKKLNRLAECQIQDAESASVLASTMVGRKGLADKLREAWINTLFGHFHDILPGSGVHWTREYQSGLFQQSAAITGMATTNSLRAVAAEVDTSFAGLVKTDTNDKQLSTVMGAGAGSGTVLGYTSSVSQTNGYPHAVIVFNPVVCRRNELVKVSIWEAVDDPDKTDDKNFAVRTPLGKIINAQKVGSGNYWGHNYIDVVFPAYIDALGYSTYIIEESTKRDGNDGTVKLFGSYGIENEFLKIDFDPSTGAVTELIDKTSGVNLAGKDKPFAAMEYLIEKPGQMSAWTMYEPIKRICPLNLVSLTRKQQGQFIASIESVMKLNDSAITVTYSLGSSQPWLEIAVKADWLERGSQEIGTPKLRIQFPFALKNAKATYEIPFGAIERNLNQGQEVPAINWADVTGSVKDSNEAAGCLLLNDCKNGHSLDGSTLSLTLLRSSYMPDPLPEMGEHTMRMALVPHNGKVSIDKMIRLGTIFNHPLQVINTDIHKGRFPAKTGDLVSVSAENVLIAALKKSEDGSGIILRLLETAGKDTSAIVVLDKSVFGNIEQAVQTDLLERPLTASVEMTQNSFTVNIPANGIATVMVNFN